MKEYAYIVQNIFNNKIIKVFKSELNAMDYCNKDNIEKRKAGYIYLSLLTINKQELCK